MKILPAFLLFFLSCFPLFAGSSIDGVSIDGSAVGPVRRTTFAVVNGSEFEDNGYSSSQSGYVLTSPFARLMFTTSATSVSVTSSNNIYGTFPGYTDIGIKVNGTDQGVISPTGIGVTTGSLTLPGTAGQIVEIVNGAQSKPASTVIGTFITSVSLNGDAEAVYYNPTQTKRLVIYGDSISIGDDSTNPSLQAWPLLVRDTYETSSGSVVVEGWGYRTLYGDAVDASARTTFAAKFATMLTGFSTKIIYIAIGTNDFGLETWSAANFGTAYAGLLDELHSQIPTAVIYAQTPITRADESTNAYGNTLTNYRTQISSACTARASYCTNVNGPSILTYPTNYFDTIHPSEAAQTIYSDYVKTLLGIS